MPEPGDREEKKGWFSEPLSGLRYACIGAALGAVKIAIDFGVSRAFGRPYSVLFYVDPVDAPLLHMRQEPLYWWTLALVAVPFVAVGIALTVRRLRDAAMSPWFALLFFVPFANLLFFLTMALVPTRVRAYVLDLPAAGAYREAGAPVVVPAGPTRRYPKLTAGAFGSVVGLGAIALSVEGLREYGLPLMLGVPTIAGFVTGAFYVRLEPQGRLRGAMAASLFSILLTFGLLVVFAIEGLGCLIMCLPLFVLPGFLGAALGFVAGQALPPRPLEAAVVGSVLLFFVLLGVEKVSPLPPLAPPPLATSVEIDAPADRVWSLLPSLARMPEPSDWAFRYAGIAYPLHTEMEGEGVGARRRCEFLTGTALETVDEWEPGRALGFTIDEQPDPMRELTLYHTVRQPHLDGYVRNLRGELVVEPLAGGRSRLTGKSWYTVRLAPERYWRLWADLFIRKTHLRVLEAVKEQAEGPAPKLLAGRSAPYEDDLARTILGHGHTHHPS
jgi:uncharacterized membrane protein YhaH (DUF805 family)